MNQVRDKLYAVERMMTRAEMDKASELAREWLANHSKNNSKRNQLTTEQEIATQRYKLGLRYALGDGVKKDLAVAYMWWEIAASIGNEDAIRGRGIIEEQMTPDQVEKALGLADKCVTNNYQDC